MAKKFKFTDGNDKWEGTNKVDDVNAKGGNDKLNGLGGDDILNGAGGNDKIKGGDGNDTIKGGSGNDKINGEAGNDIVNAGSGNDKITSTSGDDTVDGGSGTDTIVLTGNFADATITKNVDGSYTIVTATGTATVSNVENFQFADGVKDVDDLIIEGKDFILTAAADTFTDLTDGGDDTITGAAGTFGAGDIIIDNTSTDNDVMNLTLTAKNAAASKVQGIEEINVTWDAFGTAEFDATNVTGADITVSSTKVGYLGDVTITAAGNNSITAGAGAVGALTVNGGTEVTVDAANATTVTVASSGVAANDKSATVTAGATTTTVTTTGGFVTNNITGADATTAVTVAGTAGTADAANITLTKSGTVTQTLVETVNITAAAATTVTLGGAALSTSTTATNTIKSDGVVTLAATGDQLKGLTLTDATKGLTVDLSAGNGDLSKIAADTFNLKSALTGDTTVASGSTVVAGIANAFGASKFLGTVATGESLNVTVGADQAAVVVDAALETLNVTTALAATDADKVATITALTGAVATTAVTLSGADKVSIGTLTAKTFDASKATGDLTIGTVADGATSVVGSATAKNTVTFASNTAVDTSYVGGNGADVIVAANAAKAFSAVLGDGANSFTSTGLTTGSVTVLGGSGVDTISITTAAAGAGLTGTIVVQSAGGDDVVTVALNTDKQVLNANLGDGNDTLKLGAATTAEDVLTVDGGAGTDILDLNGQDIDTFTTITLTNVEVIDDSTGAGVVNGATLNGKTFEIRGIGAGSELDVTITTAGSYDFSKLTLNNTLTDGNTGLDIDGSAGADTIVATAGDDIIATMGGGDTITAGAGADAITLGAGSDTLVFNSLTGADTIGSYVVADDSIQLSLGTYTALGAVGALTAAEFVSGAGLTNGQDASDRIVYNSTTGDLYYDADGSGAGASVLLGTFTGAPVLVVGEFTIVA